MSIIRIAMIAKIFSLFSFFFIAISSPSSALELEEKYRHFDTIELTKLGAGKVDIGDSVFATKQGFEPFYGESPRGHLYLWSTSNGAPIKFILDEINSQPFGGVRDFSLSGDELAIATGSKPQLFYKDQGGVDNWGLVKEVDSPNSSAIVLSGDTMVTRFAAYYFHDRDQGGAGNWGQTKELLVTTVGSGRFDLSGDIFVHSSDFSTVSIHYRNQGGANNWGLVKTITSSTEPGADVQLDDLARFANALAIDGDTLVVPAVHQGEGFGYNGTVFVFQQNQGGADNWGLVTELQPTPSATNLIPHDRSKFGTSVDISGDTIIVGAPGSSNTGNIIDPLAKHGRYFIFGRDEGGADNWGQTGAQLAGPEPNAQEGRSVATNGTKFVVSRPFSASDGSSITDVLDSGILGLGSVPSNFYSKLVTHSEMHRAPNFGKQIAANKTTLALSGSLSAPINRNSVAISHISKITDPNDANRPTHFIYPIHKLLPPLNVGNYASDLAINKDNWLAVANLSAREVGDPFLKGQVYLYFAADRSSGVERQFRFIKPIKSSFDNVDSQFGSSLSMDNSHLAVGALTDISPDASPIRGGAVYIYGRDQGGVDNWGEIKKIGAPEVTFGDLFGASVSLSGDTLAVGAPFENSTQGSVYIFERNFGGENFWGLSEVIVAPVRQANEFFGGSIQISDTRLIVGGSLEKAYLFERDELEAGKWNFAQTIEDEDGFTSGNLFGKQVAMTDYRIAVSAENKVTTSNGKGLVRVFEYNPVNGEFESTVDLVASDSAQAGATPGNLGGGDLVMRDDEVFVSANAHEWRFRGKVYHFSLPPTVTEFSINQNDDEQVTDVRSGASAPVVSSFESLKIKFSQEVYTVNGDPGQLDYDALNPENYLIAKPGDDEVFQTTNCIDRLQGDDELIPIDSVSYDSDAFQITLEFDEASKRGADNYKVLVCGSTSITSYWDDKLDGDFDAQGGEDFVFEFEVTAEDELCIPVKSKNSAVILICL